MTQKVNLLEVERAFRRIHNEGMLFKGREDSTDMVIVIGGILRIN